MRHRVILGGGAQTIYHRPHRDGAPILVAAATYRIIDLHRAEEDADREIQASTAASVSAVSTTLAAAAGYSATDPRALTVSSATGIAAGRAYLLRSSTLVAEAFEVEAISGTTIRAADPVRQTFSSSTPVLGYELAATFPLTVADDTAGFVSGWTLFAVEWTYDGRTVREMIQVARSAAGCPVEPTDLLARFPGLVSRLGSSYDPAAFLGAAWLAVRSELVRHGRDPDTLTSEAVADAVCISAAAEILAYHGDETAAALTDRYFRMYRSTMDGLLIGQDKPQTIDEDRYGRAGPIVERRRLLVRS